MLNPLNNEIITLEDNLKLINPDRVITLNYKEFSWYLKEDLYLGVYTIVCVGGSFERNFIILDLNIIGQFRLREIQKGDEITTTELQMITEISNLPRINPKITLDAYAQSMQLEHPFGGVVFQVKLKTFNPGRETCIQK